MAVNGNNISVRKNFYNDSQMTDMNSLANAMLSKPTELSPIITHLAGKESKRFPLSFLTEGVGNVKSIDRLEYEYRVKTHRLTTRPAAAAITPGANASFYLEFSDKWFIKDYVLVNQHGEQVRIMAEPEAKGSTYRYLVQQVNPDPSAQISAVEIGDLWAQMYAPVGVDFSRGNASNWEVPGKVRNKIGTIRKSYHMSGNAKIL